VYDDEPPSVLSRSQHVDVVDDVEEDEVVEIFFFELSEQLLVTRRCRLPKFDDSLSIPGVLAFYWLEASNPIGVYVPFFS
jgi:hypothetical protein